MSLFTHEVNADGFAVLPHTIPDQLVNQLRQNSKSWNRSAGNFRQTYAARNLLKTDTRVKALAVEPAILDRIKEILGPGARAVKATFFDKTPNANWKVPPHQDVTIAVQERIDTPGFGPWTEKAGVPNVQPPAEILEQMLALRFHLDDCDENNGALKVWPESHAFGRLKDDGIVRWIATHDPVLCPVARGGVMLMRPLLIHASSPAAKPTHRRVIHIEYAACDLPNGLKWLDEITTSNLAIK